MTANIVFGAIALRPGGSGVQTYQRELMEAIASAQSPARDWTYSVVAQSDAASELPEGWRHISRPISSGIRRAAEGLRPVPGADIFHGLDVDLPFAQKGATVSTVHDMSAFDTPWAMSKVRARGEQALLRRNLRRADEVIAVSPFTADRVRDLTGRESTVITLAPAPWARIPSDDEVAHVRAKYSLPDRFAFQLATLEPRKRPDIVAEALEQIPDANVPLVLAGAGTDGVDRPLGTIGLGYVDMDDVPALYRAADVVTYASSYEGYGLPPVEAMACGAIVVASDVGAIAEACGDGAIVVSGLDPETWAKALRVALEDGDRRDNLLASAAARSAQLTWEAAGAATADVYRRLL